MGKINLGIIELTQATEVSSVSGNVDTLSGITVAHTGDTNIHVTSTEKTNLDSLATNINTISGVTSEKVSNWDTAAANSHSHSNKASLDSITGSVGTMAYEDKASYSSATQVNTALSNKANISETATATTSADYVKMVTTGGTEVKITKASFVEAMADILNNADKGANVNKVTVTGTDGKFGSVNLTNLASVLGGFVGDAYGVVDLTNGNLNASPYAYWGDGVHDFRFYCFTGNPRSITGAPSDITTQHNGCIGLAFTGGKGAYPSFFQIMLTEGYNYGSNLYVRGGCTHYPAGIGWTKIF